MMRAVFFCASLLMALPMAAAEKGTSTAQGVNEQMATAQAMRSVPKGASVVDTTCKEISVGAFTYRFQCSVHWAQ
jgi:hypothetical protein